MIEVYLMSNQEHNFHKIGISKHPHNRLRELNVPFHLTVAATYAVPESVSTQVEKKLHEYYRRAGKHLRNEWFRDIVVEEFSKKAEEFHIDPSPLPELTCAWDTFSSGKRRELLLAKPSPALDKIMKEATRKYEVTV